ncbi:hypothetical protein NDN08_000517 [Rhodosorus marinus]|uniref:Protein HGH1 C-terminal domain-containing protein n=1 Tax=Rhodosorus marinus TaxID=101924 RepID=A0AAV8US84_9RHOD|nr:hypothetical protein NDN08_000517 [Rhodosorus marinus]
MDVTARDLASILKTGKQDVKAAAAVLIAAQAAEMSSSDQLYVGGDSSAAKELVTALLLNSGDTTRAVSRSCLTALINLSADERAARMIAAGGACRGCIQSILDPAEEARALDSLNSGLLANLTRTDFGCRAALALDGDENGKLLASLKVQALVRHLSMSQTDEGQAQMLEGSAMSVGNLSQLSAGRDVLMAEKGASLRLVLGWLGSPARSWRLGAALCLRNCLVDDSILAILLSEYDPVILLTKPFVDGSHLPSDEDLEDAPLGTKALSSSAAAMEPEVEVRRAIAEALLLLCKTRSGRDAIRQAKVYPFIRNHHLEEPDESIMETLEEVVQRTELVVDDQQ